MVVIVCLLASSSCLVPQSVDAISETPTTPHFVQESIPNYLLPPVIQLYRQGSADLSVTPPCHCRLDLTIPLLEESDPTITLEVRWFVDYDPAVPRLAAPVKDETVPGDFNTSGTIRPYSTLFPFDADALGISSNGVHVVTVVVAEQGKFDPVSTSLPNRAMQAGYSRDEHEFVINVKYDADPTRPTCPASPPSVRVCQ